MKEQPRSEGKGMAQGVEGVRAVAVRRYPKPVALPLRLIMLCLRPETWPEMARYPTWVVMAPLAVMIMLASVAAAIGEGSAVAGAVAAQARQYDAQYPPLELSADGVLRAKGELKEPIPFHYHSSTGMDVRILVDPLNTVRAGKVSAGTIVIQSKEAMAYSAQGEEPVWRWPLTTMLAGFLPEKGKTAVLNGASLMEGRHYVGAMGGIGALLWKGLGNVLWALVTAFLVSPMVTLMAAGVRHGDGSGKRLLLPPRASWRIALAVLVPLVMLDGVLHGSGHAAAGLLGGEGAWLFWFFSAAVLAGWAGWMARGMYGERIKAKG